MIRKPLILCLLTALLAVMPGFAQFENAVVLGTIRDAKGAVIPNVNVTLTNVETGIVQRTQTDGNGDYLFPSVRIGRYTVSAESAGFSTAKTEEITVTVNARQRVDLTLQIGQVSEVVNVTESTPLLETDSSSKGQVIQQKQIVGIPILGRSYSNLALLVPGVRQSQVGNQGDIAFRREGSYNVNGLRSVYNNFLLDGVDNNFYGTTNQGFSNQASQPSPDSVAEFRMSINAYSAEYGRTGGAVMNVSSRSGTNRFHGTVWYFLQNTALNANGFFRPFVTRPSDGARIYFPKPQVNRNQFGFVFGGPIIKNRTFFFADYEGSRWIQSPFGQAAIPSLTNREGFSGATTPITIPYQYTDYTGRVIPAGTVIPAGQPIPMTAFARKVLGELPVPNVPGSPTLYIGVARNQLFEDKGAIKVDHRFSDKVTMFARYAHRAQQIQQPGLITGFSGGNAIGFLDVFNQQGILGTTYTRKSNEVIEVRYAISRLGMDRLPAQVGGPSMRELFGITGLPEGPRIQGGVTPQDIQGFARIGRQSTNPQAQFPTSNNLRFNYNKILGSHSLKAGYEFLYLSIQVDDTNPLYGIDAYNGAITGNALADFYVGARAGYQIATQVQAQVRQQGHWFYVQDDWKVNKKLTLNLGVRYEITSPVYDANNKLANFNPATNSLIQAKDGGWSDRALRNGDYNNFAPRVGLAYQLNDKTVIRSGYGLGYNYWNRMASAELLNTNAPYVTRFSLQQSAQLARTSVCSGNNYLNCFRPTQNGYPTDLPSNVILYIQPDSPWGYIQNWHFTIQRQLFKNALLDVAYVGNHGVKLPLLGDFNQARPITTAELAQGLTPTGTLLARRPFQGWGNITGVVPTGFSNYNGLQAKFEYRGRSLVLLNAFTYSKAIDNVGQVLETTNGGSPNPQDIRNPNNDRGPSSFDQRFNNTTSFVYGLPFGKGRTFASSMPAALDAVIGGWEVSGTVSLQSGQPLNIRYGDTQFFLSDNQADFLGGVALRPNRVPGVDLKFPSDQQVLGGFVQYLNPAAVAVPTADQPFGNLGRNVVYGFPFYQTDVAVQKNFAIKPLGEAGRLQFRAEFFNLFNRTNFQAPTVDRRSAAYGRVGSTFDPRIIQFALKLYF
jgi:hypothetical protein